MRWRPASCVGGARPEAVTHGACGPAAPHRTADPPAAVSFGGAGCAAGAKMPSLLPTKSTESVAMKVASHQLSRHLRHSCAKKPDHLFATVTIL